jgi:hypothetical protein
MNDIVPYEFQVELRINQTRVVDAPHITSVPAHAFVNFRDTAAGGSSLSLPYYLRPRLRRPIDTAMRTICITTTALLLLSRSALAVRNLHIVSPLQSLTIWDPEVKEAVMESGVGASFRSRFLPKFRAGLRAEVEARKRLASEAAQQVDATSNNWASQAASSERQQRMAKEKIVEQAYDEAVAQFDAKTAMTIQRTNPNKYQFVGVIHPNDNEKPITWYARKKPATAKWSVRLVHVNRDAILKDLFNRGKIDIFGRYDNTGAKDATTNQPIITSKYFVRERSWK